MRHQPSNKNAKNSTRIPTPGIMTLLGALFLIALGASSALVLADDHNDKEVTPRMIFTWSAPTTGTPVDHYVAQVLVNERDTMELGPLPLTEVSIFAEYGNKYRIRVAAVDADGIQGPMSLWSEPHSPELAPPSF